MRNEKLKALKRAVRLTLHARTCEDERNHRGECAIALLERSIEFGHSRLAVIRLCTAVHVGASVLDQHWAYCDAVVERFDDTKLASILELARTRFCSGSDGGAGIDSKETQRE